MQMIKQKVLFSWKYVLQRCTNLLYPSICLHCQLALEFDKHYFCSFCQQRILLSTEKPKKLFLPHHLMEAVPLLEATDVALFLMQANTLSLSFLGKVLAPLYYLRAVELGWQDGKVNSNHDRLQKRFSKLQNKKDQIPLFISTLDKQSTLKAKIGKARRLIYLIDASSL